MLLFFYNDEETRDCWSVFSHLIIDDDDDATTFILRIHGMILWICTEPKINKKLNNSKNNLKKITYQLNQQRKFLR
jgi:hypothetical protein